MNFANLTTQITVNNNTIHLVQLNLDNDVEILDINLNSTEIDIAADIEILRLEMILGDLNSSVLVGDTGSGVIQVVDELTGEILAGVTRDARLTFIEEQMANVTDDNTAIHSQLDQSILNFNDVDFVLTDEIAANKLEIDATVSTLQAEIIAKDAELDAKDAEIEFNLAATNLGLDNEVAAGIARDVLIADHAERVTQAEADLVDQNAQIDASNEEIQENYVELDEKTDMTATALRDEMNALEDELIAVDNLLIISDTSINTRLDETNSSLITERERIDENDALIIVHDTTLSEHEATMLTLTANKDIVQDNLDVVADEVDFLTSTTEGEIVVLIDDVKM